MSRRPPPPWWAMWGLLGAYVVLYSIEEWMKACHAALQPRREVVPHSRRNSGPHKTASRAVTRGNVVYLPRARR